MFFKSFRILKNMEILDSLTEVQTEKYLLKPTKRFQRFSILLALLLIALYFLKILNFIFLIALILLFVIIPPVLRMTEFTTFATMWDNMDYTGITKRDMIFVTSDKKTIKGYIYYKTGTDLNSDEVFPAMIGAHGFGSHHKVMDRYVLPSLIKLGFIYFTYDARGHGVNKKVAPSYDPGSYQELADLINEVKNLSFVDKARIGVIAMSLGGAKASVVAYPNPDVKLMIFLSSIFDVLLTKQKAGFIDLLKVYLTGFRWPKEQEFYDKLSGIKVFKKEGITLTGQNSPTPNSKRVFIFSNKDDKQAHILNTINAVEKLGLPVENYRVFQKGGHHFKGNEYYLSTEIYDVLLSCL